MFEQAVLSQRPSVVRYWAAGIGITGQLLFVAGMFIAPLIWPQLLPRAATLTWILLPSPPLPTAKNPPPAHVRPAARPWQRVAEKLIQPIGIPDRVAMIEDPPSDAQAPGLNGGIATADLARLAMGVLDQVVRPTAPPRAEPSVSQAVKSAPAEPARYTVGGRVHLARLVYRVDPAYPAIARQARISGAVELTGVIGIDGHIRELRVVKGHPFLAHAALEAVRQWVYEPTLLNGQTVEVIAPITVNFLLN